MKDIIQRVLHHYGYHINKRAEIPDAFTIQAKLVNIENPVIVDVGAHHGEVAEIYRRILPSAKIHCFEPFPESFTILAKNFTNDPLTSFYQYAISNTNGAASFNSNQSSATNSLLTTDSRSTSYWDTGKLNTTSQIEVKTQTLDSFCAENTIELIDILKIDVQGSEFSVLEGAKEKLNNQSISIIYMEMIMCPTYVGQRKFHEYLSLLDSYNYSFLDFYNPVRRNNQLNQADVLFISPSTKDAITNKSYMATN